MNNIYNLPPFKRFCMSIGNLPSSYIESLSYNELCYWLSDYLEKSVIPVINNNSSATKEIQNLFINLKNYTETYFKNLDIDSEVAKKLNEKLDNLVKNGTFDILLNKNFLKFKNFNFSKAINIIKSRTNETLYSLDEIKNDFSKYKEAKINSVCLTVEIQPSAQQQTSYLNSSIPFSDLNFRMFPDINILKSYVDLLKENNFDVYYLKLHTTFLKNNVNLHNENIEEKSKIYDDYIMSIIEDLKNLDIPILGVFNEYPSALSYSNLKFFLQNIKNNGFKVLLSGISNSSINDELISIIDGYCPHFYIKASMLGEKTNLQFLFDNFKNSKQAQELEKWEQRSNKPIFIGECGCQSFWSALWRPEQWSHTDELIPSGAPQVLYIKALINLFKDYNIIYSNYWWDLVGNSIETIKNYQGGKHE